jgi:hypothetical protein
MITFLQYLEEAEVTTPAEARRKYPNSHFPEKTAENRRNAAKARLKRMKNKPTDSGGGESYIGSPVGSSSNNNY